MPHVIAQLSDTHIGGRHAGNGERLSLAVDAINAMTRPPDLVLATGDCTEHGTPEEWDEFVARMGALQVPWAAIAGNHDRGIAALRGHRALDTGPLRLVLMDSSADVFTEDDAAWLDAELAASGDRTTVVAIHHPPFETGIWWMDCVGLKSADRFEAVIRRHPHVVKVLSGHVHRLLQTNWASCALWSCPSTAVSVAADLDPAHEPAETAEPPSISLHASTGAGVISYLVPVGASADRVEIGARAPEFVAWARTVQPARTRLFSDHQAH